LGKRAHIFGRGEEKDKRLEKKKSEGLKEG